MALGYGYVRDDDPVKINWREIMEKSIIGLVSVAIAHIDNGDIDKARDTLTGIIISLERQVEA